MRKCYVISFSVEIETLDLSTFKGGGAMEKLIGFLNMSFLGGTDIDPAMRECLGMLKGDEYKNSDVIMISDFITPALPQEDVARIEEEKARGTNFYSLVIGRSANTKATEVFADSIVYDPSTAESRREFARKVHGIAIRRREESR